MAAFCQPAPTAKYFHPAQPPARTALRFSSLLTLTLRCCPRRWCAHCGTSTRHSCMLCHDCRFHVQCAMPQGKPDSLTIACEHAGARDKSQQLAGCASVVQQFACVDCLPIQPKRVDAHTSRSQLLLMKGQRARRVGKAHTPASGMCTGTGKS